MKKFILMMLVMVGGVLSASADDHSVYLRCNIPNNNTSWEGDLSAYKFTFVKNDGTQDIYTYEIDATNLTKDIMFRFHVDEWDYQFTTNSDNDASGYSFPFTNGQWDQYGLHVHYNNVKGDNRAFIINHTSIKAAKYKITLYFKGYNLGDDLILKIDIISMPASVSSLNYATFSCNRTLDFTDVTDVTAYRASSVTDGKVVLTKVTGKVPASTGLLLKADGETATTIPVIPTEEIDFGTNLLKASVTATEVAASIPGTYHYFLAGSNTKPVGFYNLAADKTSGAGKAYLETSTELSTSLNARAEWFFEDNEATGIQQINSDKQETFFDLQGRAVKHLTNGLYIKNGKKVIVK